jgi:hypothetical protein
VADLTVMDELHLTVLAPHDLREAEYDAIQQGQNSRRLHERIRGAVRLVLHRRRSLAKVRVRVSR